MQHGSDKPSTPNCPNGNNSEARIPSPCGTVHRRCVFILDSTEEPELVSALCTSNYHVDSFFLVPRLAISNNNTKSLAVAWRQHRPCHVTLINATDLVSNGNNSRDWAPALPSTSRPSEFYLFTTNTDIGNLAGEFLSFARTTRKLMQAYFVFTKALEEFQVSRLSSNSENLVEVGGVKDLTFLDFTHNNPNYNGASLKLIGCHFCDMFERLYQETGRWYSFAVAIIHEFSIAVNATVESEIVFSRPTDGPDENGDWNDWTAPLVDGSAAINLMLKVPHRKYSVLHISKPLWYDRACFITQPPKRVRQTNALHALLLPFSAFVWYTSFTSVVCLFISLQALGHLGRKNKLHPSKSIRHVEAPVLKTVTPKHSPLGTLAALINPVIDQNGALEKVAEQQCVVRILLSLWLVVIVVLGSAYKSKVIELVNPYTVTELKTGSCVTLFCCYCRTAVEFQ